MLCRIGILACPDNIIVRACTLAKSPIPESHNNTMCNDLQWTGKNSPRRTILHYDAILPQRHDNYTFENVSDKYPIVIVFYERNGIFRRLQNVSTTHIFHTHLHLPFMGCFALPLPALRRVSLPKADFGEMVCLK